MIQYRKSEAYLALVCEMAKRGNRLALVVSSAKRKREYTEFVLEYMRGAWPIGLRIAVLWVGVDYGREI